MDGVLESTIALCGCKLLFSFLCLPAFKSSLSSVSLCCVSLLLFTDLSITAFLVYLWSAAPKLKSFHPSSDVIALRSVIFLSETYEGVLMLTPLLVAVEQLVRLLWVGEFGTLIEDDKEAEDDVEGEIQETGRGQKAEEEEDNNAAMLKALGFLSCLMLWLMCGTYAGFSWRNDVVVARSCLEKGNLLSMCLPCLLTSTSPVTGQLFWALPAAVVLVAFAAVLNVTLAKPTRKPFNLELMGCGDHVGALQTCPPMPEKTSTASVCPLTNYGVEEAANSCAFHISHNNWQPAQAKSNRESVTLVLQLHRTAPRRRGNHFWQTARESPHFTGEIITGLLCGLLVCVSPTVLSTNVLLVISVDTLAVCAVKHLLTPAAC